MSIKASSLLTTDDDLEIDIQLSFPSPDANQAKSFHESSLLSEQASSNTERSCIIAILLHPYGPLGGSKEDHVIRKLSVQLSQRNMIVVAPNMRGVGNSQGRTSWTAKGECRDLKALLRALLLPQYGGMWDNPAISQTLKKFGYNYSEIILFGYSYGSMIASSVTTGTLSEIIALNPSDQPNIRCPSLSTILLSYPLSVAWALSLWNVCKFKNYFSQLCSSARKSGDSGAQRRVLIVFGGKDQFTSCASYETWLQENGIPILADDHDATDPELGILQARFNSQADHFWAQPAYLDWLIQGVLRWLEI